MLLEVFEYGLDDWISFESVARILSRFVKPPEETLCSETSGCVSALVGAGWFRPGLLHEQEGFVELTQPLRDALIDVCEGWSLRDPTTWDALWLDLTEAGRVEALRRFPELEEFA